MSSAHRPWIRGMKSRYTCNRNSTEFSYVKQYIFVQTLMLYSKKSYKKDIIMKCF